MPHPVVGVAAVLVDNRWKQGLSSRSLLERLGEIQMLDVSLPLTDGRELPMRRYTKPEKVHELLLDQLGLSLPNQPPPEMKRALP